MIWLEKQAAKIKALDEMGNHFSLLARPRYVIFVTAYDEHALRAFEVSALDYLLKPIDGGRFFEAIERARNRIRGENLESVSEQLNKLMAALRVERNYLGPEAGAMRVSKVTAKRNEG